MSSSPRPTDHDDETAATASLCETVVRRGLHPSRNTPGGDLWAGMDHVQRHALRDCLGKIGVSHDEEDHELGRLPYVCPMCALAAALVILEGTK